MDDKDRDKRYIEANLKMRKGKFNVKVTDNDTIIPGEKTVHVTYNGHSWQYGFSLIPSEARQLIIELEKFATPNRKHVDIDTINLIYGNNLKE